MRRGVELAVFVEAQVFDGAGRLRDHLDLTDGNPDQGLKWDNARSILLGAHAGTISDEWFCDGPNIVGGRTRGRFHLE